MNADAFEKALAAEREARDQICTVSVEAERESNARRVEAAAKAADKAANASSSFAGEALHTAVAIVLRGVAHDIRTGGNTPYPGEEIDDVAKGNAR